MKKAILPLLLVITFMAGAQTPFEKELAKATRAIQRNLNYPDDPPRTHDYCFYVINLDSIGRLKEVSLLATDSSIYLVSLKRIKKLIKDQWLPANTPVRKVFIPVLMMDEEIEEVPERAQEVLDNFNFMERQLAAHKKADVLVLPTVVVIFYGVQRKQSGMIDNR